MKTYVYISDRKVDMYYDQIPHPILERLKLKLSAKFFGVEGAVSIDGKTESRLGRLRAVERYIEDKNLIGDVEGPKSFFRGRMQMGWGTLPEIDGTVVFAGRTTTTNVVLCGSLKHLVNPGVDVSKLPHRGEGGVHTSRFYRQLLSNSFLDEITDDLDAAEEAASAEHYVDARVKDLDPEFSWDALTPLYNTERFGELPDFIDSGYFDGSGHRNANRLPGSAFLREYEFVSTRLMLGKSSPLCWVPFVRRGEADARRQRILIGTPIYVALADNQLPLGTT